VKVTIHQPTYMPYLGVFAKIKSADAFVVYDTAQYEKGSVHNRQRIRTDQGFTWLTIPLTGSLSAFNETMISYANQRRPWYEIHWRSIELNYKKTPFFGKYKDELYSLYHDGHPKTLAEFNLGFLRFFLREFGLGDKKTVMFSEMGIDPALSPSEKLACASRELGAREYISGPSGKHYLQLKPFESRKIDVSFFDFQHPVYPQYHSRFDGEFLPNMGAIDALLNTGGFPEGDKEILEASGELNRLRI
jgi:hypothetical protein